MSDTEHEPPARRTFGARASEVIDRMREHDAALARLRDEHVWQCIRGTAVAHLDRLAAVLLEQFPEEAAGVVNPDGTVTDYEAMTERIAELLGRLRRWES